MLSRNISKNKDLHEKTKEENKAMQMKLRSLKMVRPLRLIDWLKKGRIWRIFMAGYYGIGGGPYGGPRKKDREEGKWVFSLKLTECMAMIAPDFTMRPLGNGTEERIR